MSSFLSQCNKMHPLPEKRICRAKPKVTGIRLYSLANLQKSIAQFCSAKVSGTAKQIFANLVQLITINRHSELVWNLCFGILRRTQNDQLFSLSLSRLAIVSILLNHRKCPEATYSVLPAKLIRTTKPIFSVA